MEPQRFAFMLKHNFSGFQFDARIMPCIVAKHLECCSKTEWEYAGGINKRKKNPMQLFTKIN